MSCLPNKLLVDVHQPSLSDCGKHLAVREAPAALADVKHMPAGGYRARRNQHDLQALDMQPGNLLDQGFHPVHVEPPAILVNRRLPALTTTRR